jgi:hypothetical protein
MGSGPCRRTAWSSPCPRRSRSRCCATSRGTSGRRGRRCPQDAAAPGRADREGLGGRARHRTGRPARQGPDRVGWRQRGGIGGLAGLLADRWDEVEADFQHYYRLDLRREAHDAGCRRLWALINGLPGDAAIHRHGTWSRTDEIAALRSSAKRLWGVLLAGVGDQAAARRDRDPHPDRPVA